MSSSCLESAKSKELRKKKTEEMERMLGIGRRRHPPVRMKGPVAEVIHNKSIEKFSTREPVRLCRNFWALKQVGLPEWFSSVDQIFSVGGSERGRSRPCFTLTGAYSNNPGL